MAYVATVPVFLVVGYLSGAISRRLMPTYERGCLQLVFLAVLAAVNLLIAIVLLAAVEEYVPEAMPDDGDRVYLAPLLVVFAFGFLMARLRKHRSTVARRRRVVQPSGSYAVPPGVRTDRPTAARGAPGERPLPTPFNPGGRDVPGAPGGPLPPPPPPPSS
ncbi:MAG: hypothetical protein R2697_19465 [Ilumatobacteraceae bacterium]